MLDYWQIKLDRESIRRNQSIKWFIKIRREWSENNWRGNIKFAKDLNLRILRWEYLANGRLNKIT